MYPDKVYFTQKNCLITQPVSFRGHPENGSSNTFKLCQKNTKVNHNLKLPQLSHLQANLSRPTDFVH